MKTLPSSAWTVVLCAAGLGFAISTVSANTFTVRTTEDIDNGDCDPSVPGGGGICSLREAVKAANANPGPDTIVLLGHTYPLTLAGADDSAVVGDLDIRDGDVTIRGLGLGSTAIDGAGIGGEAIFDIDTYAHGISVTIENLTLRNAKGIAVRAGGTLELNRCAIWNSPTGINVHQGGTATINYSIVSDCSGYGVWNRGVANIDHSTVELCRTSGVHTFNPGRTTITDSIIRDNTDVDSFYKDGGGIHNDGGPVRVDVIRTQVTNNTAGRNGGGVHNVGSTLNIIDSVFDGNKAGTASTSAGGGAIYNYGGTVNVTGSTLSNNRAVWNWGDSGAIYSTHWSHLIAKVTISNSTVSGNSAHFNGGVFTTGGPAGNILTVASSTITANNPGGLAGSAAMGPYTSSVVTLRNSIIAGNVGWNVGGPITSNTFSITGGDPILSPLANNGGFAPTHAPALGSPAIDAGDPAGCTDADGNALTVDQRGIARPQDGDGNGSSICDIGAVESNDCNGNGFPDASDVATGASLDCNGNGFPDECDIGSGNSQDTDGNGVPDECEIPGDLDGNGQVDLADHNAFLQCLTGAGNGVLTGCEAADLDANGDVDLVDIGLFQTLIGG